MGWFWNKNNHQDQQNQQNSHSPMFSSTSESRYSYSSKKKSCQNDPNDDNYIICKTIIKDNNGTRQEEQRIPKNDNFSGRSNQSSSFQGSSLFNSDNFNPQKVFENIPSFFIQPSFFDFHNSGGRQPQNQLEEYQDQHGNHIQRYFNQYSQSKQCQPDPQNNQYLICKSKIFDGKQAKQIQQRVKVNSPNLIGISPFFSGHEFSTYGNKIDRQIQNMMKDMNEGFGLMMPIIGSMFNLVNALDPQYQSKNIRMGQEGQHHKNHSKYTQYSKPHSQNNKNYFTSSGPKDTNVYDL